MTVQLRRSDVLAGAIALLDAEGLDGLTMRKLGERLGVQPGALYWHFANKHALLEAMAEELMVGVGDDLLDRSWDDGLLELARRQRRALLAHRDGARVMAGTYVTGSNTMDIGAIGIDMLRSAGFSLNEASVMLTVVSHYVLGHTIEEQAFAAFDDETQATKLAEVIAAQDEIGEAIHHAFLDDPGSRFEFGIAALVQGFRVNLESH